MSADSPVQTGGSLGERARSDDDRAAIASAHSLLARQRAAFGQNMNPSLDARLHDLEKLATLLLSNREAIASAISADFGNRSRHESLLAEVFVTLKGIRETQKALGGWMKPRARRLEWLFQPGRAEIIPQPLGVIGILSPWNYPVQLALAPLTAALAAGNRAMLKPSELTPKTSLLMKELLSQAFSEDKVAVIVGGPLVGEAFAGLDFDHLIFTGSTRVGRLVMRAAAETLTPVTLELGGKSPVLIHDDAPLEDTALRVMTGKLFNAGQTCIAPDYALVPRGQRNAWAAAFRSAAMKLYPRLESNPDYTHIINDRQLARLRGALDEARAGGATVYEVNPAGEALAPSSRVLAPHVVVDAPLDGALMQDEIFGPILPVVPYDSFDDALGFINARPRPLALYSFGRSEARHQRVLRGTVAGGVTVNETLLHVGVDDLPFGGVGPSGMGRYHGQAGFDGLSQLKPVFHQYAPNATALLRPPFGRALEGLLKVLLR